MKKKLYISLVIIFIFFHSVSIKAQSAKNALFTLLDSKQTNLYFTNTIHEDDSLNVLRYEYLYNGAGVAISDFNNDGLPDIFFSSNTSSNKLFINKGNFKFEDVTSNAHVGGNGTWSTGASVADVNGDGLLDIYVCHSGKYDDPNKLCNELFINQGIKNGIPVFKEMAKQYGLDAPGTQSTQAVFFDYDNDGDLDMFLLNHSNNQYDPFINTSKTRAQPDFKHGNRLFRNDKDANGNIIFTDVTLQSGIINNPLNFGLSVTVSDINKDGWPDIYTTSDYSEKDCYYINNHNGTFTESLEKSFAHISKYSMGADIADYNNDGRPDVFTLDMLPEDNHRQKLLKGPDDYDQYHLLVDSGFYYQQMRNMLQLNEGEDENGNIRFSEIGQLAGVSNTDWSWSGLLADFDNDGWKDLFISNGYLRDYTNMDFLKFAVADAKIEAAKQGNQNFQTYNLVQKMPSNKLSNYIFQNNHNLTFSNKTKDWGLYKPTVSNAAAYADFDNDGDLDLIVCNNNEPALLYRNNENEILHHHYIKLRLTGEGLNTKAYGAKAEIKTTDGNIQYQELYPVRGYQSTVTQDLVFGLADNTSIDEIKITWTNDKQTILKNTKTDTTLVLKQSDAQPAASSPKDSRKIFTDVTKNTGINFIHKQNDFIDFKSEPLLPYQLSKQGPALAKADVNGDGLEDIFLGGDINQSSILYLQNKDGKFYPSSSQPWSADSASEDVNALFLDANNDGSPDLYVVSGGNVYDNNSPEYQDRLYINDGKGNFSKASNALPKMLSGKCAVAVGDFDNDGYLDLFIGGRGTPGSFPLPSKSYLLHNDSKNGSIHFSDVTDEVCSDLRLPGMVTSARFADINRDHFPDLIIAGDWMPVMLFKNNNGKFENISDKAGLKNLSGMWSSITLADVDGDGKTDFILGNCGLNNQFKASEKEPVTMYAADFDNDGLIDPVMCYYIGGASYPMASKDELLDEIPSLKKKFIKYSDYADAKITDIFSKEQLKRAQVYRCDNFSSGILYGDGMEHFEFRPFPAEAQVSKIYGALIDDFDKDGIKDILIAGNYFSYKTELGKDDASFGLLLKGFGNRIFKPIDPSSSHCYIDGDVRALTEIKNANENLIIAGKNGDAVQVLKWNAK
jgi:hypothetical protein